ncbi:replicative DNA helicase, partial [Chlamydiota bacterium]
HNRVNNLPHFDSYLKIVREKETIRKLITSATEIVEHCYDPEKAVDYLLDYAEQKVFDVVQNRVEKGEIIPFKELIKDSIETVDKLYQKKGTIIGVPSGFTDFDEKTSGLQPSDLIVIAARPSMGKTALALNIAEYVGVEQKMPVAIFSLEMSKEQLVQRLLCSHARVNLQHVRKGFLSKEDWPHLVNAANKLSEAPILIDDSPSISALELRAKARRMKANYDIQLLIIDYLQLMRSDSIKTDNRQQEISEISRALKGLARELSIPVIMLSQLNRAAENRPEHRPQLSDLRESGAIEQDADLVVLLLRKEYYNSEDFPGEAEINIAKQRNGPVGKFKLTFIKEITRFENYSEKEFED